MPDLKCVTSLGEICVASLAQVLSDAVLFRVNLYNIAKELKLAKEALNGLSTLGLEEIDESIYAVRKLPFNEFLSNDIGDGATDKKYEEVLQDARSVEDYAAGLARDMTMHCHSALHQLLYAAVSRRLNIIYMKYQMSCIRKMIEKIIVCFISPCLREFDFTSLKMLTRSRMFESIYAKLPQARRLEKLVFGRSCYWRSDSIKCLSKTLAGLNHLKVLHIHYICNRDMLQTLHSSCPNLTELSLKGSSEVGDNEVQYLLSFDQLITLDISGTHITGRGCWKILKALHGLKWLTHCPFNCNSDSLIFESRAELFAYIRSQLQINLALSTADRNRKLDNQHIQLSLNIDEDSEDASLPISSTYPNDTEGPPTKSGLEAERVVVEVDNPHPDTDNADSVHPDVNQNIQNSSTPRHEITFNLHNFWLFNPTTDEILLTLVCPDLEHLRLDFVMQDVVEELDAVKILPIQQLDKLNTLVLNIYDQSPIAVVTPILQTASSHLTHLSLYLGDDWFFVAPVHNVIAATCPSLKCLSMTGDYKGNHILEDSDSRLDFTLPSEGLSQLEELHIAGCVTTQRLLHILIHAPYIRIMNLDGELEYLHDDLFTTFLQQGSFANLTELWFNVSTSITLQTVKRLLLSPSPLKRIGRLCLMSGASKELYQELLLYVRLHNLDVELIWVTDQRDVVEKVQAVQHSADR